MSTATHTTYEAQQQARAAAVAALRAQRPDLTPASVKGGPLIAAAKNMRFELSQAFPGVKFSVKSDRYSAGTLIDVCWTNGPTSKEVEKIINRYKSGSFDGITDSHEYSHSLWLDAFGQAKSISTRRKYSDSAIEAAIQIVADKYSGNFKSHGIKIPTAQDFRIGKLRNVWVFPGVSYGYLQELIQVKLASMSWAASGAAVEGAK